MSSYISRFGLLPLCIALLFTIACKETKFSQLNYHEDGLVGVAPVPQASTSYFEFEYSWLGAPVRVRRVFEGRPDTTRAWAEARIETTADGWTIEYYDAFRRPAGIVGQHPHRIRYQKGVEIQSDEPKADAVDAVAEIEAEAAEASSASDSNNDAKDETQAPAPDDLQEPAGVLSYYDRHTKPVSFAGGVWKQAVAWDADGRLIEARDLDRNNRVLRDFFSQGHRESYRYDEEGRLVSRAIYDQNSEAILNPILKYHRLTYEYGAPDADGKSIRIIRYYDAEGELTESEDIVESLSGCAIIEIAQTDRKSEGYTVAASCKDAEGEPRAQKSRAYHTEVNEYDAQGLLVRTRYLDAEGEPVAATDAAPEIRYEHDEHGWPAQDTLFNEKGEAAEFNGVHRYVYKADPETGLRIQEACFDLKQEPVECVDGWHMVRQKHNDRGIKIETAYFDVDGKPATGADGVHRSTEDYNENGLVIESKIYNAKGEPTLSKKDAPHRVAYTYDEQQRLTSIAHYDAKLKPMIASESKFHRIELLDLNEQGLPGKVRIFGADEKPGKFSGTKNCSDRHLKYNEYGDTIDEAYFRLKADESLEPCQISIMNVHRFRMQYNGRGQRIEQSFFNNEDKATTAGTVNVHKTLRTYYPNGRLKTEKFMTTKDKPASNGYGDHRKEFYYYPDGRLKRLAHYRANGSKSSDFKY